MSMGLSISRQAARVGMAWRNGWQRALAALLPQDCLLCGAASGDELLCTACAASLPRLPDAVCPVCALPTPAGETCGACLGRTPAFDATVACFAYAFPVDRLVHQLKFGHRLAVAGHLARALLARGLPAADLIVPVPLSAGRLRERGFNQAAEIARILARESAIPLGLETGRRTLEAPPQSTLPWKERQKNVRGAFECATDLDGRTVLVIDDVMTTGATLGEFARALKNGGATRVIACVAARAVKGVH
jgi:ComF family protein